MSEARNPDHLTRQPREPSRGGDDADVQKTPEEALAEAREAQRAAEEQRDAAHAREQAVTRERDEARSRAETATGQAVSAHEKAMLDSIEHHKGAAEQAKAAIANAQAAGDPVAVAEAFDKLADSRAELRLLDQQKRYFETERERQKTAQPTGPQSGQEITTPGGTLRVSEQVKRWTDTHSRFYNDKSYYNHAIGAHQTAVADGMTEGSPAYFRALDDAMTKFERYEAFERGELQPEARQVNDRPRRPASSMGAPTSRSTESRSSRGEPSETAIAQRLGVTPTDLREYARINGYRGEEGYKRYLADHQEIIDIERQGGKTGLNDSDMVYR